MLIEEKNPLIPVGHHITALLVRHHHEQVQHLANVHWSRWKEEYLCDLQGRGKLANPIYKWVT